MTDVQPPERGIHYWMNEVVAESEKARDGFKADPVHDLRVAIRRCRSIAEGFLPLDPHPSWKKLRKVSKPVFSALGDLRDIQVQMEWVEKISAPDDQVAIKLMGLFQTREQEFKSIATAQLAKFDAGQWLQWADTLQERSLKIPLDGDVFKLMALERLGEAHRLHSIALRNRSKVAWHELRIGIKKFRYIVENFLPELHDQWKKDLKQLQDWLGEVHDLDVLWETANTDQVFVSMDDRKRWQQAIRGERDHRIAEYRSLMVGRKSLWQEWRSELPVGEQLRNSVEKFFETWAFFRDPDQSHSYRVLEMSLAIFDALSPKFIRVTEFESVSLRDLLIISAITHNSAQGEAKPRKQILKSIEKLTPPPGWTVNHLKVVGLGARYQYGALPSDNQKTYANMKRFAKRVVDLIGGVLRLAEALDFDHSGSISQIVPQMKDNHLLIEAAGYQGRSELAQRVAEARYLLESICGVPILVRSVPEEPRRLNRRRELSR